MNSNKNRYQRNGYTVKFDNHSDKWAVFERRYNKIVILEMFTKFSDAEKFCYAN